jgi:Biotin/lipoate A/B protein ligase family
MVEGELKNVAGAGLDLPPGFSAIVLKAEGDAFAHAVAIAAKADAGTLVWAKRPGVLDVAIVLEPAEALSGARRAIYAGIHALADAVSVQCPPEVALDLAWPATLRLNGARAGGGRLGWPRDCAEDDTPQWLVFGALVNVGETAQDAPGLYPDSTSLFEEGFEERDIPQLIESFSRHLMASFHKWSDGGFGLIARDYFSRLNAPGADARRAIDAMGDLLLAEPNGKQPHKVALVPALEATDWYDPASRNVKR